MKVYPVSNKCVYGSFEERENIRIAQKIKNLLDDGFDKSEIIDILIGEDNEDLNKVREVMDTFFSERPIRRRRRDLSCLTDEDAPRAGRRHRCVLDILKMLPKKYSDIRDKIKSVLLNNDIDDVFKLLTADSDDDIAIIPKGNKALDDLNYVLQKLQLQPDDFMVEHEMDAILQDFIDKVIDNMYKVADYVPVKITKKDGNSIVLNDGINDYIVDISGSGVNCQCPFNLFGNYDKFGIPCCHIIWVMKNLLDQKEDSVEEEITDIPFEVRAEGNYVPCEKYDEEVDVEKVCRFCRHCKKIDHKNEYVSCSYSPLE